MLRHFRNRLLNGGLMEDWCPNQPKRADGGRRCTPWFERADTSERRVTNPERRVTPRKDEGRRAVTRTTVLFCLCQSRVRLHLPTYLLLVASVNLVPLLWTGVPTSGRQALLRMFPCPGSTTTTTCRVFPEHLITELPVPPVFSYCADNYVSRQCLAQNVSRQPSRSLST